MRIFHYDVRHDMKTILWLISELEVGGAEKALAQTLPRLTEFENTVVVLFGQGPFGRVLSESGVRVEYLNPDGTFRIFRSALAFRRLLKAQGVKPPDLVVTMLFHADVFGRLLGRLFGIKRLVCWVHSALDSSLRLAPYFLFEFLTSRLVTAYFAVSQEAKNAYVKKARIAPGKITVIPNGVEVEKFHAPHSNDATAHSSHSSKKRELGLGDADVVIGSVSRLNPEKGIASLVQAFPRILEAEPKAVLVLAGDGPERESLRRAAERLGIADKTLFLGNRNDVPALLPVFDVFVQPGLWEGMSMTLLEAMAAGRAIVASDIPQNRALIESGKEGLLVPKADPPALGAAVVRLLRDPGLRASLGAAARRKAEARFSLSRAVEELSRFLSGLA